MSIPFYLHDISEAEVQSVLKTLTSGWINTGPQVEAFEALVKEKFKFKQAVATNSATAGLFCVLKLMGLGPGDEVITTPYTFTATAAAILHTGARPIFCDIGRDYNINPNLISPLISKKTKAIIPVDFAGKGCDIAGIKSILHDHKHLFQPSNQVQDFFGRPIILSDSSHAFGSYQNGHAVGREADFAVFSFHVVKNITTADGGMVVSGIEELTIDTHFLFSQLRQMISQGMSVSSLGRVRAGGWEYDVRGLGFKYNMTDLSASLGIAQLHRWEEFKKKRLELYAHYQGQLQKRPQFELWKKGRQTVPHLFPLSLKAGDEKSRNALIQKLESAGITCNVHFKPLPLFTFYRGLGYDMKDYPVAFEMYEREISLPFYCGLSKENVDYIASQLNKCT